MNRKSWNDLNPAVQPIVERGPQTLWVVPWVPMRAGLKPHVVLRMGEETDSQMMQLTMSEARRIAIALLQAAERAESAD